MTVLGARGLCRPVHLHSVPSVEEGGGGEGGTGDVGELGPSVQGEGGEENWRQGRELVPRKMRICLVRTSQIGGFSLGVLVSSPKEELTP